MAHVRSAFAVLVAAFLTVVMVVLTASGAEASNSWGSYHWARTANPFTLKLGDNLSTGWKTYLGTASTDWSQASVLDTAIVAGAGGRRCQANAGRVEVCNRAYGNNGWLGLAQIWVSGTHITKGVVKVNDTYFSQAPYNTPAWKQDVTCQEVGHTLGLDHTSTDGSSQGTCMDYSTTPDVTSPNQHDYDQLGIIYQHLDSSTTLAASPTGSVRSDDQGSDDDGTPAGASPARGSRYVQDLGGGRLLITEIIWANGR